MKRRPLASVFVDDGTDGAWCVANTPSEVAEAVNHAAPETLIELTLANRDPSWNGRSVFVQAGRVRAISPPMSQDEDDEATDVPHEQD